MIHTQPFFPPRLETRKIQTVSSAVISLWRVTVFSSLNTVLLLGSQNRGDAGCFSLGKSGTGQVPEGPSIPTTDLAIDLFDPKSSMSFMDFSLQSLANPCCNYWLHRTSFGMDFSLTLCISDPVFFFQFQCQEGVSCGLQHLLFLCMCLTVVRRKP